MARSRARVLWSNPGNPPASVARALGMEPRHFSRALHKIKAAGGSVDIVELGNLHDED